jgi:hypothetical protein
MDYGSQTALVLEDAAYRAVEITGFSSSKASGPMWMRRLPKIFEHEDADDK